MSVKAAKENPPFRLGTRKSQLAMTQSRQILERLATLGVHCELREVVSSGDMDRTTPLYEIETSTPGLFTKQLESALLAQQIDLAVHSLKDLPTVQAPGLKVSAIPSRIDSEDCLLIRSSAYHPSETLGLKRSARIGTSSLRREAQFLSIRADLNVEPVRGNVPTRLQKAREGEVDAVVLAKAGLLRLGLDLSGVVLVDLPIRDFVPAPGQGALAVETRNLVPSELRLGLETIHDPIAARETSIERKVLRELEGGCTLPLGVRCWMDSASGRLELWAFLGLAENRSGGRREWRSFHRFDIQEAEEETLIRKTVAHFKGLMNGR